MFYTRARFSGIGAPPSSMPCGHTGIFRRILAQVRAVELLPVLLFLLAAVRALNVAAVQMPFNGWDELAHIAVAYHVHANGRMPNLRSPMSRDLIPFVEAHPHPTSSLGMLRGVDARPYPGDDPACSSEPVRRYRTSLYQAQHGPLYYHATAALLGGVEPPSLLAWVDAARIGNIVLLLATLCLWRVILRVIAPRGGPFAWLPDGVLLLLVSFSYVYYNFVRFANDALALFLGSAALALAVVWIKPRCGGTAGAWRFAALGALTGLAVLAKATSLALLPVFAAMAFAGGDRWKRPLSAFGCLLAFTCCYLVVAGPYHLDCLARHGQLTGMQEAVLNGAMGKNSIQLLAAADKLNYGMLRNPVLYNATLHQAGWSNLISPQWINLGFKTALGASLALLAVGLARSGGRAQAWALAGRAPELPALMACGVAAMFYHALQSALCWGVPTTGPWYGMLFLPVLFAAYLLGPALWGPRLAGAALLYLALLCNAAYLHGTYDVLLTQQTGVADFYKALRIVVGHHALLKPDLHLSIVIEYLLLMLCLGFAAASVASQPSAPAERSARSI